MQAMQGKAPEEKMSLLGQALQQGLDPDVANRFGMSIMQEADELRAQNQKKSLEQQEVQSLLQLSGKSPEEINALAPTLTPTSARELLKTSKSSYEPESEKIAAKRQSEFADAIIKDYQSAETSSLRLKRMAKLNEGDKLTTPFAATVLEGVGLPLGILSNPDSEEFAKLEADFSRDASKYFPGQVRTAELVAFMKSIPSLMNSKEGRDRVIQNLTLIDEAKKERYEAYKEIIKENRGFPPSDLDVRIFERTKEKMSDIGDRFANGISDAAEPFQSKVTMYDASGKAYSIPASLIPQAMEEKGLKFK